MLTIERIYELAQREAHRAATHPACDHDDLVQCAVIGIVEADIRDEALATIVARRRIIDELRRQRGRPRTGERSLRTALHESVHLYRPLAGRPRVCLADVLPADDDSLAQVESRVDALREVPALLRAVGRRAKHVLLWHLVQEQSSAEIAHRSGVSASRVAQITAAAIRRARAVHAAREHPATAHRAPAGTRRDARSWFEPSAAEKRAFGAFRRLQRAGLRQPEALAVLTVAQRALVTAYQRKCQRRARARAAGEAVPAQPPRRPRRDERPAMIDITPAERAAAGAVWTLRSRGASGREALAALTPQQRGLAASYNAKMRCRARVRSRQHSADEVV